MKRTLIEISVFIVMLIALVFCIWQLGSYAKENKMLRAIASAPCDTVYMRDTSIYNFPDIFTEIVIADDAIEIPTDSLVIKDDSLVVLPITQKHYKGKDYEAWISGYKSVLDSIWVFPETVYITKEIAIKSKPKRWGVGIQAGYGIALPGGKPIFAPYIGVGISYNLIRF